MKPVPGSRNYYRQEFFKEEEGPRGIHWGNRQERGNQHKPCKRTRCIEVFLLLNPNPNLNPKHVPYGTLTYGTLTT